MSRLTDDGEAKDDVTLSRAAAEGNDPTLPAGEGPAELGLPFPVPDTCCACFTVLLFY